MGGELLVDCFEEQLEVDDGFGLEVVRVQCNPQHVEDEVLAHGAVGVDRKRRGDFVRFLVLDFHLHLVLVFPDELGQVRHVDVVHLRGVLGGTCADVGHVDGFIRVDVEEVVAEPGAEGVDLREPCVQCRGSCLPRGRTG